MLGGPLCPSGLAFQKLISAYIRQSCWACNTSACGASADPHPSAARNPYPKNSAPYECTGLGESDNLLYCKGRTACKAPRKPTPESKSIILLRRILEQVLQQTQEAVFILFWLRSTRPVCQCSASSRKHPWRVILHRNTPPGSGSDQTPELRRMQPTRPQSRPTGGCTA